MCDILSDKEKEKNINELEKAIPYLREAVEYAICKGMELEEGYQRHFYALFLLAEFQDKEVFGKIIELVSLPGDEVDYLIGDAVTEGLRDILYNTYDGNLDLLKKSVQNREINEFVRSAMMSVLGQLYLDGLLEEGEWKDFLKKMVYDGQEYDEKYSIHYRCEEWIGELYGLLKEDNDNEKYKEVKSGIEAFGVTFS